LSEGAAFSIDQEILVVHVDISVLDADVADFLAATAVNAAASRAEAGVLRFDVVVDRSDPTHVVLVEVYRDQAAAAAHKQTGHYAAWRDTVAAMMARPRSSVTFTPFAPSTAAGWSSSGRNPQG